MGNKFYITTSIAYTNSVPHCGYALELIQADVIARYHRLSGDETWFLTGTDEHGLTVQKAAEKAGLPTKEFVDTVAAKFIELTKILNISNNDFIRTSDQKRHWPAAQKIWQALAAKGDLYKKEYEGLYCVGHEAFMKKSDLVDGRCPLHKTEPEKVKEENWFFRLTKYKDEVKKRVRNRDLKILPETKVSEILNIIDDAEDVSFSRPKSKLQWGIPVPDDPDSTIYVWSDALVNYLSALGYTDDSEKFKKFWPADVHLIGKDILRFHALIWPAMLLSADIELPRSIFVHGFITADGEKMSKTIGNVVDPFKLVEKYGVDPVRYFLLREIPSDEDGDFSEKKLVERYNSDLANGLGNLVQRVATLIENKFEIPRETSQRFNLEPYKKHIENFQLHKALEYIWMQIGAANKYIDAQKPWVLVKDNPEKFREVMIKLVVTIRQIAWCLEPFLPDTASKISKVFGSKRIKKGEVLFPRLD